MRAVPNKVLSQVIFTPYSLEQINILTIQQRTIKKGEGRGGFKAHIWLDSELKEKYRLNGELKHL